MNPLAPWQNFCVIVGSAAGALTGLQFVAMALMADMPLGGEDVDAGEAFATPSVFHFGAVLLLSATLAMPWSGLAVVAGLCGVVGLFGAAYIALLIRRMRRQGAYKPVAEDWFFRVALPLAAYVSLAASAFAVRSAARAALFAVGAAALLLLFVGIHNAWDNVTYIVFVKKRDLK